MQIALFQILIWFAMSISYNNNLYAMNTSILWIDKPENEFFGFF